MKYIIIPILFLFCACSESTDSSPESTEKPNTAVEKSDSTAIETTEIIEETVAEPETPVVAVAIDTTDNTTEEFDHVDWEDFEASMTIDYSFVIVMSIKSYDAALERANDAADKMGYELNLRGLHENKEIGLSFSEEICNGICGGGIEYPVYIPRSSWGNTKYVSVEYSDGFKGFTKGYYIVVVASGEKGDAEVKASVEEARKFYSDAYAKTCGVYMGCGC